ncbi:hypothetical protein [Corynebacterium heidelbergense]|uniref:Uncharacterized protein n=1 Tax=Corynebacterium heidelbergense TaxID=2055947 RepID=A0A364VBY8_9CORY|nr:hypothetical protein [Corynebacterium heidelbergense]RAV34134.1 hypothetical protein CWC39_04795 [Corynebacterium heidelbergense]WCZ36103.1 hypothetical protein CHEID_02695 [Corynebacterium heidelbergense]
MWRRRKKRDIPEVFILFERDNESLSEQFAGLARTEQEACAIARPLDTDTAHCLIERVELEGWEGKVTESTFPDVVYLAFREGREQGKPDSGRGLDPEILGAFTTGAAAQKRIEQRRPENTVSTQFNIWRVGFELV